MATMIETLHAAPGADLVRAADRSFARDCPYPGEAFRHHCHRLYRFADLLLERDGLAFDRSTLYAIAMYHDLGLVNDTARGATYMARSLDLFDREVGGLAAATDERIIEECLLLNHRVRPVRGVDRRAELFRRAVWVEHTRGFRRYGLDRAEVRAVFARHPRLDLDRVLLDFARRVLRREPVTILRGIFF